MPLSHISPKATVKAAVNAVVVNHGSLAAAWTSKMRMVMRIIVGFNLLEHLESPDWEEEDEWNHPPSSL